MAGKCYRGLFIEKDLNPFSVTNFKVIFNWSAVPSTAQEENQSILISYIEYGFSTVNDIFFSITAEVDALVPCVMVFWEHFRGEP